MVAKISRIKPKAKSKKDSWLHLKISLPSPFHARYGYIYVIRLKQEKKQVKIREWRKKLEATKQIKLRPAAEKEKLFFAIVDEETGAALYGRGK